VRIAPQKANVTKPGDVPVADEHGGMTDSGDATQDVVEMPPVTLDAPGETAKPD
jgi:hypothetical protein